jgi:hypothetical protein
MIDLRGSSVSPTKQGATANGLFIDVTYNPDDIYIRKSMLGDYDFCPWKFKESWMQPGKEGESEWGGSYITKMGTRFHDFAQNWWNFCEQVPIDRWHDMIPDQFNQTETDWAHWWIDTEERRYLHLEENDLLDMWKPVSVENKLIDKKLKLTSTFDRLDWWDKDAEELAMIEYKTGTSFYAPALMSQLAFYSMVWEDIFNFGQVRKLIVINPNLKLNGYFDHSACFTLTDKMIDNVINKVAKLRKTISTGGPFPRKCTLNKYKVCRMCLPSDTKVF